MKKIYSFLFAFIVLSFVACQSDEIVYQGKEYVLFADSAYTMPVLDKDTVFCVPVAATTTAAYDRNYAVEVINSQSTAIRGYHFDFVDNSNNITIKAGQRTANVKLKGHYSNVGRRDSLVVSLRLVEPENQQWDLYGNISRISLVKCHPFVMDEFRVDDGGNLMMYATFPFGEMMNVFFVKSRKVDSHTLILDNMFGSASSPIRILFDDSNPLDLTIRVPEQPGFRESTYGVIWVRSVAQYPSYFNTFDRFFVLYLEAYMPGIGSFGVYQYVFRCISREEADDANNGAATYSTRSDATPFSRVLAPPQPSISTFKFNPF